MRSLDYPPIWLIAFMVLAFALMFAAPWPGSLPWLRMVGIVLMALGLTLTVMAALEMRRARTTVIPHRQPSALVTAGVFSMSRNPIYLSDLLILTGWVLALGSVVGLLLVPLLAWVLTARFIRPEEARLAAAFGPDFADWKARVRRWI